MTPARPIVISAILFDFDGTLTRPHNIDFAAIKRELGCPQDEPVLEFIESMADPQKRRAGHDVLDRFELGAAATAQPNEGAEATIAKLAAMGLPLGVLTRNTSQAITRSLKNFNTIEIDTFAVVLTRDDDHEPKPNPAGMTKAAAALGVDPAELLCVGDFVFDVEGAQNAGCISAFLTNGDRPPEWDVPPDLVIDTLSDLVDIAQLHRRLRVGKLPNALLTKILDEFQFESNGLAVGPGVGEDCAVIDPGDPDLLVITSDPITFATDEIGHYVVTVCANDIATTGATPRWFLTTLLLPVDTTAAQVHAIMRQVYESAASQGIELCGGHTEITDAVTRPVIVGQMIGAVAHSDVIRKDQIAPGDRILFTKRVAVEGTAVIARELPDRLVEAGVPADVIERAAGFLHSPGISVAAEAGAAAASGGVSAMHDVTEGGLATAVHELSISGHLGVRTSRERIPVYRETAEICRALGLDPLGLIGSGSLLIACRASSAADVMRAVEAVGVEVFEIGEVIDAPAGIAGDAKWPEFSVDEIAGLFGPL